MYRLGNTFGGDLYVAVEWRGRVSARARAACPPRGAKMRCDESAGGGECQCVPLFFYFSFFCIMYFLCFTFFCEEAQVRCSEGSHPPCFFVLSTT